jgi:hypothetical protein
MSQVVTPSPHAQREAQKCSWYGYTPGMNPVICQAIQDRRVLTFRYDGHPREVEPYAYGVTKAGNEALWCYQTGGSSRSGTVSGWHLMRIDKIIGLTVSPSTFADTRPIYQRGTTGLSPLFCG